MGETILAKKRRKTTERIVEAYCHRPLLTRKNPFQYHLGYRKKMKVAGGCVIAISEKKAGSPIKYFGAGTVKIIPMKKQDIKAMGKDLKKRRRGTLRTRL